MSGATGERDCVREALRELGVERLVFAIHDASFPSGEDDDTGRGSPASPAGHALLRFVRGLGFDGVQLGPSGETGDGNPSPYDGTLFSRNLLSISLARLARDEEWAGLLAPDELARAVERRPPGSPTRVPYACARRTHRELLERVHARFAERRAEGDAALAPLAERFAAFRAENADWLEHDALYEVLEGLHRAFPWRQWSGVQAEVDRHLFAARPGEAAACERRRKELQARHREAIERYAFLQFLAHAHHARLHAEASRLALRLHGDLQIGFSERDAWACQGLFLAGYRMGAPPSRTNPDGQPWGYPVLDPDRYFERGKPGPVLRFVSARMEKFFREYDAVRIDHPHGLVCPWVYRADVEDAYAAVQGGARLFASPDLPDHPALARLAIARPEQLGREGTPRHADDWVRELSSEQVDRYSVLFDAVVAAAESAGREESDLVCEVLSTLPHPLARVLERHGLGRFRVTQKADLDRPDDVYRSENARPEDWIMVGTHDTRPVWLLAQEWQRAGALARRARYLAERLVPEPRRRADFAAAVASDPLATAQAQLADLFASRARHVMVFFADVFGETEVYNRPGVVAEENWSLRLPADYARTYRERAARGAALNLPRALATALRARADSARHGALLARLDAHAAAPGSDAA